MYQSESAQLLAGRLGKLSIFRAPSMDTIHKGLDYCIYTGVPVQCLSPMENASGNQVIDLLICRGREVIYAIVIDPESRGLEQLFSARLPELPHLFFSSGELIEDVVDSACGDIEFQLRCDRADPLYTGCTLHPVTLSYAAAQMHDPALGKRVQKELLLKKHLIRPDGSVTVYGQACGLFRRQLGNRSVYVTAYRCIDALHRALNWHEEVRESRSLKTRLSRLKQGLPSDAGSHNAALLRQLLDTPLEALYACHGSDLSRLRKLLARAQLLSLGRKVTSFADMEEISTYGQCLRAIFNFWEYTAQGDCRNGEAADICRQLLAYLSYPLWSVPLEDSGVQSGNSGKTGLGARLKGVSQANMPSAVPFLPLGHYFHAAAILTESEYPIWLCSILLKPWLGAHGIQECSFARAMDAVYRLSQSGDEEEQGEYFPLLYNILVEPFTGLFRPCSTARV